MIVDLAAHRGAHNVRVFGSVARGEDTPRSDVDLLVDLDNGVGLVALAGLERALTDCLTPTSASSRPTRSSKAFVTR